MICICVAKSRDDTTFLKRKAVLSFFLPAVLAACTNPFCDNYHPLAAARQPLKTESKDHRINVLRTSDLESGSAEVIGQGYVLAGVSCFVDADTGDRLTEAVEFGYRQHADLVLLWNEPVEPSTRIIPSGVPPRMDRFGRPSSPPDFALLIPRRAYCAFAWSGPESKNASPRDG